MQEHVYLKQACCQCGQQRQQQTTEPPVFVLTFPTSPSTALLLPKHQNELEVAFFSVHFKIGLKHSSFKNLQNLEFLPNDTFLPVQLTAKNRTRDRRKATSSNLDLFLSKAQKQDSTRKLRFSFDQMFHKCKSIIRINRVCGGKLETSSYASGQHRDPPSKN